MSAIIEKILKNLCGVLVLLPIMISCKSEEPELNGDLILFVTSYDINGNLIQNKSDVSVSVKGTGISGLTDEYGRVELNSVPTGDITLTVQNDSFAATNKSIPFLGNGLPTILDYSYMEMPNGDSVVLVDFDQDEYYLDFVFQCNTPFSIHSYFGTSRNFTKENANRTKVDYASFFNANLNVYGLVVSVYKPLDLTNFNLKDSVYVKFYVSNWLNNYDTNGPTFIDREAVLHLNLDMGLDISN